MVRGNAFMDGPALLWVETHHPRGSFFCANVEPSALELKEPLRIPPNMEAADAIAMTCVTHQGECSATGF